MEKPEGIQDLTLDLVRFNFRKIMLEFFCETNTREEVTLGVSLIETKSGNYNLFGNHFPLKYNWNSSWNEKSLMNFT